jgi:tRNA A37 methylthiotransferase MiaB
MQRFAKKKSFFIYAKRGCFRRISDVSRLHAYFLANQWFPVNNSKEASLIIIFGCGSLKIHEENSILTIKKSSKNKHAQTVVTGCLPKINPDRIQALDQTILMIKMENLGKLDSLI